MFQNLRLKYRILLGYAVPLLLSVVVAVVVYSCVATMKQKEAGVDTANEICKKIMNMESHLSQMASATRGYLLVKDKMYLQSFNRQSRTTKKAM